MANNFFQWLHSSTFTLKKIGLENNIILTMSSFRHLCFCETNLNRFKWSYVNIWSVYGLEEPCKLCYLKGGWSDCLERIRNYLYTKTCKTLHNALIQPLYYCFDTDSCINQKVGECARDRSKHPRFYAALFVSFTWEKVKTHVIRLRVLEGPNTHDQIAFSSIPFILSESSKECCLHTW